MSPAPQTKATACNQKQTTPGLTHAGDCAPTQGTVSMERFVCRLLRVGQLRRGSRFAAENGGCAGRSKHQPYQTGAPGGSSSALLRHRFWGTGRCLHTGSESVNSELLVLGRELARRNPRLSLRLRGSSLLRLAARTFLALLFQEPPRLTRLEPVCPQT